VNINTVPRQYVVDLGRKVKVLNLVHDVSLYIHILIVVLHVRKTDSDDRVGRLYVNNLGGRGRNVSISGKKLLILIFASLRNKDRLS